MTTTTHGSETAKEAAPMAGERYLNVDAVAAMFGVARKTVYSSVSAKTIPHVTFSRSVPRFR